MSFVSAVAALCATGGACAAAGDGGRFVVAYRTEAQLAAAAHALPATVIRRVSALHTAELRLRGSRERLAAQPGILGVTRPAARSARAEPALLSLQSAPDEWQFPAAREDAVPDWVLRAASSITVAVIDTGADLSAPDLAAKTPTGWDPRTHDSDVADVNGHGTFVSSLAAGSVTNGDGMSGFGGDAHLLVVRAGAPDGTFDDVDEAAGVVYAVDHGAKVINLSVGGPDTSPTERRALDYAAAHGALVVAAAGNEHDRGNPVEYPAALLQPVGSNGLGGQGLAVGASTPDGARAGFSNTGSYVSLLAPGVGVFGAVSQLSSPVLFPRASLPGAQGGLYGYGSGTSFAAPEVAGAAALVWAANPSLDASAVAQILKQTATGRGTWTRDRAYGVLDVGAAVARALDPRPVAVPRTPLRRGRSRG